MSLCNKSVQTVWMSDGWPRRHCQPHCFDSFRVNAAAASCATSITIVTVLIATTVISLSHLALNIWRNRLSSPLKPSERKCSACSRDWHIHWYVHTSAADTDPFPSVGRLRRCDFGCIRNAVGILSRGQCVHMAPEAVCHACVPSFGTSSHLRIVSSAVHVHASTRCIRSVPPAVWLVWGTSCTSNSRFCIRFDTTHVPVPIQHIHMVPESIRLVHAAICAFVVSILFPMVYASMRMLDASIWFLSPSDSSGSRFGALIGFIVFDSTLRASPCPVDMSAWLLMPSISNTACFMSPMPRYILAPSAWPITSVSESLDLLGPSVKPFDAST
ncbi:hypothetical protein SCLCIDRAFT_934736 [Scleroderma citrinum Foug A]|uniref:Uncharacterized protein n=1 Tax=Scleroderma citrinum Foug A TaxID=1036808 RepID=A0A0C3DXT5_9AGAM|nr:hypothetical protein SCLCIDRAFT_934736 [Scleroderma citrinum Foug A]